MNAAFSSLATQVRVKQQLDAMVEYARATRRNGHTLSKRASVYRQNLAQAYIRVEIMLLNLYRGITSRLRGQPAGPEASLDKLYWSEMDKWMQELGMELQGPYPSSCMIRNIPFQAIGSTISCAAEPGQSIQGRRRFRGTSLGNAFSVCPRVRSSPVVTPSPPGRGTGEQRLQWTTKSEALIRA